MTPTPTDFGDRLRGLDAAALTAFVAAVYAARGWAVERDSDGAADLLVRPDGETDWRRLVVDPTDRSLDSADCAVVPTLAPDADAAVVDAADLLELLRYAVDDAARTRLCRDFFDRDPDDVVPAADRRAATDQSADAIETPPSTADSDGTTAAGRSDATHSADSDGTTEPTPDLHDASPDVGSDPDASPDVGSDPNASPDAASDPDASLLARRLAAAVVVLLVVGGVAVAVGPTLVPSAEDAGGTETADADAAPTRGTETADTGSAGVAVAANRSGPSTHAGVVAVDGPLPPGVDETGIENASALVDAHEAALSGRSYRLSVVAREFVGGRPTAVARERTVVEGPARYRSNVSVIGTFRQEPRAIGSVSAYANGTMRFVRLTTATEADGTIRFTERGRESGMAGGPGWRRVAVDPAVDPFANRTATHLRGALAVDDAAIVGSFEREGTTYVWIDLHRRPPGGTGAIDSVLVDEHGLVHEIRHEYAYLSAEASTVRTVVTVRIEPATVSASSPPWVRTGSRRP